MNLNKLCFLTVTLLIVFSLSATAQKKKTQTTKTAQRGVVSVPKQNVQ